ncbi:bifunctional 2-C-methyl-D-erythritol 4-phosphate cytidylyltransferase/2-C-methyl-D-erythritol 2,4-cyclodiphosphate synthase [Cucumibacter marinus]|uniref:bifunctional 2-C-methyl-D-erythritol 4-phosphate cytidylyltransferase/2-C-methyl-D-erythritol 2,4-cyclodiphosphate synthase n=1 Tax=Cucumibacter marinus TaxID=1121252 RepID=UPI00041B9482|nr:bifunctional 2-C-methyl-D-erythritol 4-phosphate cytidylyltransferase/2-C-methyl-D-erythritol 2,4-cyclodiphosphate synthase [Cucumibacter marinus]
MPPPAQPFAAILVAAGSGSRMGAGDFPKQYRPYRGKPVIRHSIEAFLATPGLEALVCVIAPNHRAHYDALGLDDPRILAPVPGGATRQQSVLAGLEALGETGVPVALIHDAARPNVTKELIVRVAAEAGARGGALPVRPVTDTIKQSDDGDHAGRTLDRSRLFAAQTPQGFAFAPILDAHRRAADEPGEFTDDAAIAEWAGLAVTLVEGEATNTKLTYAEDFHGQGDVTMETRIGTGFDVHAFEAGDHVTLCGVQIPHDAALKGHSDADVGMHAITDALYGALAEGDIGRHFPPSEARWKAADSRIFLDHAAKLVAGKGGRIVNLDVTIICETPKIGPHAEAMRHVIAGICGIAEHRVSIKATTSEQLGFTGRREGIAAMASASIEVPRDV